MHPPVVHKTKKPEHRGYSKATGKKVNFLDYLKHGSSQYMSFAIC